MSNPTTEPGEHDWELAGAAGERILGVAHVPFGNPSATVTIVHGFKGYMDYGMFPRIAGVLAGEGFLVHCFNFSHSGMTRNPTIFERPDLFERDTWNHQVQDLAAIDAAIESGAIPGGGLPRVWLGHSRGGASVLLAAGRGALRDAAGLITIAAPARLDHLDPGDKVVLRSGDPIVTTSSRTGQELRIGPAWLTEQDDDPAGHDLLALVASIAAPVLVLHGADDATVDPADARRIAEAIAGGEVAPGDDARGTRDDRVRRVQLEGGTHVLNVQNPLAPEAPAGPVLERAMAEVLTFLRRVSRA